jgi:hypothetical protein
MRMRNEGLAGRLAALLEARAIRPRMPTRNPRPEKLTMEQAKAKYGRYLQPPWYLIDPAQIPFPDSADFWWSAVARMATEGRIVARGKPNYEQAMRFWKNQVKRHYGFRPKRTKRQSMMEGIRQHLKGASRRMGLEKQRPADQQRAGRVTMAAKLIRAQATQKRAAKALAAQALAAKRSAAAVKGHETRRALKAQAQTAQRRKPKAKATGA